MDGNIVAQLFPGIASLMVQDTTIAIARIALVAICSRPDSRADPRRSTAPQACRGECGADCRANRQAVCSRHRR